MTAGRDEFRAGPGRGSSPLRALLATGAAACALLVAGCAGDGSAVDQVPAVLSTEDAQEILPGPEGNFVVMVHLQPDGSTIPFVMRTPREARPFAGSLAGGTPAFIVDVPGDATEPLVDAGLNWRDAIISSESRRTAERLDQAADQLADDARLPAERLRVDASITAWTQGNPSHMAGAYVIRDDACIAVVARQAPASQWVLTAIPQWTDVAALRAITSGPGALVLSDSTKRNPSRIAPCQAGS